MVSYPWYESVEGASNNPKLEQGDIFVEYPVLTPKITPNDIKRLHNKENLDIETDVTLLDIIVMTQSCDLENNSVDEVILCSLISFDMDELSKRDKGKMKEISQGKVAGKHLLKSDENIPYGIVDFKKIYTTPKSGLLLVAEQMESRRRLLPPYKEHLSQAFARYFMRVGLPVPMPAGF